MKRHFVLFFYLLWIHLRKVSREINSMFLNETVLTQSGCNAAHHMWPQFLFCFFFSVIFDFLFFVLHKISGASIHGRCIDGGNLHNLITYLRTCLGVARTYEWTRVFLSFFFFLLSTPANGCCCRFRLGFLLLFQYRLSKIGEVFSDKIPIFVERPISKLHPEIPLGLEFLCAARERWFSAQIRGSIKCAREQSSSHPPTTFSAAFKRRQVSLSPQKCRPWEMKTL